MIAKYTIYLLIILQTLSVYHVGVNNVVLAQNTSTVQTQNNTVLENEEGDFYEDDSPMLVFLLLFALLCIGVGIVLTILALLIIFGLIGAGILSASILVGLHKKSFSKAFKTFLLSSTTIGGLIIGLVSFWAIHAFLKWWALPTALISGGITGIISGLLLGYFAFYVIQKLTAFLYTKLKPQGHVL